MLVSHSPAAAAEFPNDNPLLHHGARWVCRETLGAARAIVRASGSIVSRALIEAVATDPPAAKEPPAAPSPALDTRRYAGPLELDLDRVVIAHRVENVPPPPEFIFRPFVRAAAPLAAEAAPPAAAIRPRSCHGVDALAANARVRRSASVDVAPCVRIEETPPIVAPGAAVERPRRSRRRAPVAARALVVAALPDRSELQRAIAELEAAFAKPALHSRSHEGARVSPCRAGAV